MKVKSNVNTQAMMVSQPKTGQPKSELRKTKSTGDIKAGSGFEFDKSSKSTPPLKKATSEPNLFSKKKISTEVAVGSVAAGVVAISAMPTAAPLVLAVMGAAYLAAPKAEEKTQSKPESQPRGGVKLAPASKSRSTKATSLATGSFSADGSSVKLDKKTKPSTPPPSLQSQKSDSSLGSIMGGEVNFSGDDDSPLPSLPPKPAPGAKKPTGKGKTGKSKTGGRVKTATKKTVHTVKNAGKVATANLSKATKSTASATNSALGKSNDLAAPGPTVNAFTTPSTATDGVLQVQNRHDPDYQTPAETGNASLAVDIAGGAGEMYVKGKKAVQSLKDGHGRTEAAVNLTHAAGKSTSSGIKVADALGKAGKTAVDVAGPAIGLATGTFTAGKSAVSTVSATVTSQKCERREQSPNTPPELKKIAGFAKDKLQLKAGRASITGGAAAVGATGAALSLTGGGAAVGLPMTLAATGAGAAMEGHKWNNKRKKIKNSGGNNVNAVLGRKEHQIKVTTQKVLAENKNNVANLTGSAQKMELANQVECGKREYYGEFVGHKIKEGGPEAEHYLKFARDDLGIKEKHLNPQTDAEADKLGNLVADAMAST